MQLLIQQRIAGSPTVYLRIHRKRASTYMIVIGCSMLVTTVGLAALLAVRVERHYTTGASGFTSARHYALSGIERAIHQMANDPDWRSNLSNGTWYSKKTIGSGSYSVEGVDPNDGDLSNSPNDSVVLVGTGVERNTRYKLSVQLAPYGPLGMEFLASSIHATSSFTTSSTLTVDASISSNYDASIALAGVVNGDIEVVNRVSISGTLNGTSTEGIEPKEEPDASIFDYYIAGAVAISISALPLVSGYRELAEVVISPGSNPFGASVHADGLYLLDCMGADLRIRDLRIHGSLVILDPGVNSEISGAINWEPYNTQLPTLLVRGSILFNWSGSLIEGSPINVNFNPTLSPYNGSTDALMDDTYPGVINGLIYVSSDLNINKAGSMTGMLFGLNVNVYGTVTLTHDVGIINSPPPGFERSIRPMGIVDGSWKQVVD